EPVPPEGIGQRPYIAGEDVEAVGVFRIRLRAVAVAAQVGGRRVPAGVGQPVDSLDKVVLGAGEAVHQQHAASVRGTGFGDFEGETARVDPAQLHHLPPAPVNSLRSTT